MHVRQLPHARSHSPVAAGSSENDTHVSSEKESQDAVPGRKEKNTTPREARERVSQVSEIEKKDCEFHIDINQVY